MTPSEILPSGSQSIVDRAELWMSGTDLAFQSRPSHTYKIDFTSKRLSGMIDGLEAVKQAVFKILNTERFRYFIYSSDYGSELFGLIGEHPLYVESELERRIQEALMQDDRIDSVDDVQVQFESDRAIVRFVVHSSFGDFTVEQEVSANV